MRGKSQSGYEQNKIWLNRGNREFEDVSNDVCPLVTYDSRGVALADLWNTGALDVIVANQNNIPLIYKNDQQNSNHWIEFELKGTVSNADAIGAKVVLDWNGQKQVQVVTAGLGFASQNEHRLHFGLNTSKKVEKVTIYWPSGEVTTITDPQVDQLHVIKEKEK